MNCAPKRFLNLFGGFPSAAVRLLLLVAAQLALTAASAEPSYFVPLTVTNDHLVAAAKINGTGPYNFIIDSAAQDNVLSSSAAAALRLPILGSVAVNGIGANLTQARRIQAADVDLGNAALPGQSFLLLDSALQVVKADRRIDGVLGLPLFKQYALALSPTSPYAGLIPLTAPSTALPVQEPSSILPLSFEPNGIALISASVNGIDGSFELDTGSNAALILYPEFVAAHPGQFDTGRPVSFATSQVGGEFHFSAVDHAAVKIGSSTADASPAILAAAAPINAAGRQIAGNIGYALLKNYTLLLDLRGQLTVYANPFRTAPRPPAP